MKYSLKSVLILFLGHVVQPHPIAHPLRKEPSHQLYCQFSGEKEILLIDQENDFLSWNGVGLRSDPSVGDTAVLINVKEMDYQATPQFKDLKKVHIAHLKEGQCIYVPARWIHQVNVMTHDHSLEMRWKWRDDIEGASKCEMRLSKVNTVDSQFWSLLYFVLILTLFIFRIKDIQINVYFQNELLMIFATFLIDIDPGRRGLAGRKFRETFRKIH